MDSEILWCFLGMVPKLQPPPHLDHPLVAIPKIFAPILYQFKQKPVMKASAPVHYSCRKKVSISKGYTILNCQPNF